MTLIEQIELIEATSLADRILKRPVAYGSTAGSIESLKRVIAMYKVGLIDKPLDVFKIDQSDKVKFIAIERGKAVNKMKRELDGDSPLSYVGVMTAPVRIGQKVRYTPNR